MECSLGHQESPLKAAYNRLNPYSNGMLTWNPQRDCDDGDCVLILILMECSLGGMLHSLL